MDPLVSSLAILLLIAIVLGLGVWVFAGLAIIAILAMALLLGFPLDRIGAIGTRILLSNAASFELAAIPMFIWMGEILCRTDIADRLFRGLTPWVSRLPGGLLHSNIAGCTLFAAISGSSTATTATVGRITLPALQDRGYDDRLATGSLAGAGSFGLLIPPSISMIIYGVQSETSITKLFIAGLLPGLMMAALYGGYIMLDVWRHPERTPTETTPVTIGTLVRSLGYLAPVVILICAILGSIYTGIATPSEAAAVGVALSLVVAAVLGELRWSMLVASVMGAVKVSCMIMSLMVMASLLSTAMGYLHLPQTIATAIGHLNPSPSMLLVVLALFYVLLGMFLDGVSIILMSLPITLPLVLHAGFDPVWFGVFLVILIEMGAITPPVGFNLYVIQGLTGISIGQLSRYVLPFFGLMVLGLILLATFPAIAIWLPG